MTFVSGIVADNVDRLRDMANSARGPVIVVGVSVGAGVIIGLVIAAKMGRTEVRA